LVKLLNDDPTNAELMRAINKLGLEMKEDFEEVQNCLWGPNRDNGLVTTTSVNAQRICRLEKVVYGLVGAITTMIVGIGVALIIGVI